MFDVNKIREDFPILERKVKGKSLVYLDSAATSQKPIQVIEEVSEYYQKHNANVHRGVHSLGNEATDLLEEAREKIVEFVGGSDAKEGVFVRNATEALNLLAYSWGKDNLSEGDVVLLTEMEHNSNIVPWQKVAKEVGARVEYVKVKGRKGELDWQDYHEKLSKKVKLVSFVHVSNILGTVNPVKEMVELAKKVGATVIVDGAQAVQHMRVNVSELGVDFYVFSGHKMLGPMGIGFLWGKEKLLNKMSSFLSGGGMVKEVEKVGFELLDLPEKFEAGTPNVAGAVGLRRAVEYLEELGRDEIRKHDRKLVEYALASLESMREIRILGGRESGKRVGSVSFVYEGVHGHDVASILDSEGVEVRAGQHCGMILHDALGVHTSVRASFGVYTTKKEIDQLVKALEKVKEVFV